MNSGQRRLWVVLVVMGLLMMEVFGGTAPTGAAPSGALDGSFATALALRQIAPGDASGETAGVLLLTPGDGGVTATSVTTATGPAHVVGWRDASNLLYVRRAADGSGELVSYNPSGGAEQVIISGLALDRRYQLTPDRTRVVSWPHAVPNVASFGDLRVYDAASMSLLSTLPVAGTVTGPELAGWSGERVYFFAQTPGDALLMVDLSTGTVHGPVDLLAAGDGSESIVAADLSATAGLALVGRINPKNLNSIYTVALPAPDYWPATTPQEPRPSAQATPQTLSTIGEAQRVFWNHGGAAAAIVSAEPGEFGSSALYLTDSTFAAATATGARAAFNSCVLFTPDDNWLLYVGEAGDSLLALSVSDPAGVPQTLYSGAATLNLCEAVWQPSSGQTVTGGTGGTGGVTLGGGTTLSIGAVVNDEISGNRYAVDYTIALRAGDAITVSMVRRSGDLDCLLFILGPDGGELATNDDAAQQVGDSFLNAQIVNFVAPADGTYTVRATRFRQADGPSTGAFELRVEQSQAVVIASGTSLNVGSVVFGEITDAAPVVNYTITLETGQAITVTMERQSDDLDCYLSILDSRGIQVAYNDDAAATVGNTGLNSQIPNFVASTAGTYTIQATRFMQAGGSSTGQYRLSVTEGQAGGVSLPPAVPISVGQTLTGEITDAAYAADYTITLQAGQRIVVTMERQGGTLDAYLYILDSFGGQLAFNDDAPTQVGISTLNSMIDFTAPAAGTYTIRATRLLGQQGSTSGQYLLRVAAGTGPGPSPSATPGGVTTTGGVQGGGTISTGQTLSGTIQGSVYAVEYSITLRAGETIAVTMQQRSGDLDAFLVIYDTNDQAVAYDDDATSQVGDSRFNARIPGYTAPLDGTYYIWATRYQIQNGSSTGAFEISVAPGQPVSSIAGGTIRAGDTVTGEITDTIFAVEYTITLRAGDMITVTMERLDVTLDAYLVILDSFGNALVENDDADTQVGDSALNAQIVDFTAPGDGTYVIRATRYFQEGGPTIGRFQLQVESSGSRSGGK